MPISIEADPTLAQGYIKVNGTTAATITTAGIVSGGIPAGAVMPFAMNSAPSGWLAANGDPVNRLGAYAALFAAIGTTHGVGDGSTTFNLPDLRGIFVRGAGDQTISGTAYSKAFALKETDTFKSHTHPGTFLLSSGPLVLGGTGASILAPLTTGSVTATGGTETRPANIALLYCIKF